MKLRIPEIEILPDDPFRNDNLERKYAVEGLTNILGSTTDPLVISVNAPWGYGKTTFLKMLHAHLLNNGFKVVRFNAWESDYIDDPFVALLTDTEEQLKVLKSVGDKSLQNKLEKVKNYGKKS